METQHYSDCPNHSNIPASEFKSEEEYTQTCINKFTVK